MNEVSKTNDRRPWLERLALFAISFVFWLLLVWPVSPVDGRLLVGDIVAGLVVAAFVAMVMGEMIRSKLGRLLNPVNYFWAIIFDDIKEFAHCRLIYVLISFNFNFSFFGTLGTLGTLAFGLAFGLGLTFALGTLAFGLAFGLALTLALGTLTLGTLPSPILRCSTIYLAIFIA